MHLLAKLLAPVLTVLPHFTTFKRAARVISHVVADPSDPTGVYYDENGKPLKAPAQVNNPAFSDRYIQESRDLLATVTP